VSGTGYGGSTAPSRSTLVRQSIVGLLRNFKARTPLIPGPVGFFIFTYAVKSLTLKAMGAARRHLRACGAVALTAALGGADAFAIMGLARAGGGRGLGAPALAGIRPAAALPRSVSRRRPPQHAVPTMQLNTGDGKGGEQGSTLPESLAKPAVWVAWLLYMQHIFLSDAPCGAAGGEMCGISLPVSARAQSGWR